MQTREVLLTPVGPARIGAILALCNLTRSPRLRGKRLHKPFRLSTHQSFMRDRESAYSCLWESYALAEKTATFPCPRLTTQLLCAVRRIVQTAPDAN